ncbi:TIGR03086 family metal-binding protein [Actinocorallia longicatena]|uniref:TIGR03086 family metal-binding protein n=1 Tax=Actinocorallia longicatena TaxID=111803 RepID=A0ABP6PWL0_9ACTN
MAPQIDLATAAAELSALLAGVRDDQLTAPTPCADFTVADLIDHVDGLCPVYAAAAVKRPSPPQPEGPSGDGSRLPADWRTSIPPHLDALALAWSDPAAWAGTTRVSGHEAPAQVAGVLLLTELIVHGWDLARATARPYTGDPETLGPCLTLVSPLFPPDQRGADSYFAPAVEVPADASPLDHLIAFMGRHPSWTPS